MEANKMFMRVVKTNHVNDPHLNCMEEKDSCKSKILG